LCSVASCHCISLSLVVTLLFLLLLHFADTLLSRRLDATFLTLHRRRLSLSCRRISHVMSLHFSWHSHIGSPHFLSSLFRVVTSHCHTLWSHCRTLHWVAALSRTALPHSVTSLHHSLLRRVATLSRAVFRHTFSLAVHRRTLSCIAAGEQQNIYYCRINIGPIVDGRVAVGGVTINNNTVTTMVTTKTATSYCRGQKSNK